MPCSNAAETASTRCLRLLVLAMLLAAASVHAEDGDPVRVLSATSAVYDGWHVLDADIRFAFDEELLEALEHGVRLDIDVLVEVRRQRKWLWDPVVSSHRLGFTLQHHPLTGAYVVTQPVSGTRHEYPDARTALGALGTIRNYHLLNAELLEAGPAYDGYIMARLNIDTLPAPLQTVAYVSPKWRAESGWLRWGLIAP